ncbi:alpha/beta fold hydrolase [Agaribacterium haliotis]|uniref:alpha/beta fold hydrolase n=1 Tax=Agaribacterium haliotis TaxID=2013869 RepID=UPI000BB573B9|nr:alpha/beta hydrolase [Agaribacterium haliotis]
MTSIDTKAKHTFVNSLKNCLPAYAPLPGEQQWPVGLAQYFQIYGFDAVIASAHSYEMGSLAVEGYELAAHQWRCDGARAEVLICHGLFDHVGLYLPLVSYLLQRQFNVIAYDLPEHGLSSGKFGELSDFQVYENSLLELLQYFPASHLPRFAVGQSTGAAILASVVLKNKLALSSMALLAPLLRVRAWSQIKLAQVLLGPWLKTVRRSFSANSHDRAFVEFLRDHDPLQANEIATNWTAAMLRWEAGFDQLETSSLPVLLLQGSGDKTVAYRHNIPRYRQKFENMHLQMIDGGRHHLVAEAPAWRTPCFDKLGAFFESFLQ